MQVFIVVFFAHTAKLTAQLSQIVTSPDLKFGNHCSCVCKIALLHSNVWVNHG